jgi:hypothetical protein
MASRAFSIKVRTSFSSVPKNTALSTYTVKPAGDNDGALERSWIISDRLKPALCRIWTWIS